MAVHLAASAQTHVQLNLNVKHKLGDVTEFNRPKFINFHATINENYWDSANKIADLRDDLIRKYDVYVGRETGMIKTVLRNVKEDPERPGFADPDDLARLCSQNKKRYVQNTKVHPYEKYSNLILCNQFSPFYPDGTKTLKDGLYRRRILKMSLSEQLRVNFMAGILRSILVKEEKVVNLSLGSVR